MLHICSIPSCDAFQFKSQLGVTLEFKSQLVLFVCTHIRFWNNGKVADFDSAVVGLSSLIKSLNFATTIAP